MKRCLRLSATTSRLYILEFILAALRFHLLHRLLVLALVRLLGTLFLLLRELLFMRLVMLASLLHITERRQQGIGPANTSPHKALLLCTAIAISP